MFETLVYPTAGAAIFGVYMLATGFARDYMKPRRKISLGWLLPLHNATLCLVNAFVFLKSSHAIYRDTSASTILLLHYIARVAALLDTFVLILRKRSRRLTWSHYYSRIAPVFPILPVAYLSPDKSGIVFACATESLVQSWVYLYYAFASLGLAILFRGVKHAIAYANVAQTGLATVNFARLAFSKYSGGTGFVIESVVALVQISDAIVARYLVGM